MNAPKKRVLKVLSKYSKSKDGKKEVFYFNIDEFKNAYQDLRKKDLITSVQIILLEESALVLLNNLDLRVYLKSDKFLSNSDFTFIENNLLKIYGATKKIKLTDFIKGEIALNPIKLLALFIFFSGSSILINDIDMIRGINSLIVTSSTLFISIFIVFISSNLQSNEDYGLIKSGQLYRFFQNDKYILLLAFLSLLSSLLSVVSTYLNFNRSTYISSILVGVSATLLGICFLAIYQYHLERVKHAKYIKFSNKFADELLEDD